MRRAGSSHRLLWGLLLLCVAAQVWFTLGARTLRAAIEEMPPPPTDLALKAMAFGDDEFLFRHLGRWLEFVGDGGGRVRPLREYDYDRVVGWLQALDHFDSYRSDYTHFLAAQYFGEVNIDHDRVRKIVEYLRTVGLSDPVRNWKWLAWGAQKSRRLLKDPALVRQFAGDLQSPELASPAVPPWVHILPYRLYRALGDENAAREALARISPADMAAIRAAAQAFQRNRAEAAKPPPGQDEDAEEPPR